MEGKIILGGIGSILTYLGILMIVPLAVALYDEGAVSLFVIKTWIIPLAVTTTIGVILKNVVGVEGVIKRREGFVIVAFGWLAVAVFGALPYIFSSTLGPVDAFFESMSGFTTTGSTVIPDLMLVDCSILLWRSFTQWFGGMGVILLFIAILPTFGVAGSQLFDREFPGPMSERIRPRVQVTARMLWSMVLTAVKILALFLAAKMSLYDSSCTAFCTMPTGGFSPHPESIGGYMNRLLLVMAIANMLNRLWKIPNPKHQITNKFKYLNSKQTLSKSVLNIGILRLGIVWYL
jgi:trk system potassium uptake protein TrkH